MMSRERIEYLDLIKGISIILVVFCHRVTLSDDTVLGNIVMAAAWAAVPNFFFVSGGLMHQSHKFDWKKYLRKLIRAYIVLCIWKLLYLFFYPLIQEVSFSKTDLIKYLFLFGDISGVATGHIWFMYAYILVLLFFPVSYFLYTGGKDGQRVAGFVLVILFICSFMVTAGNFFFEILSRVTGCGLLQISISAVIPFGSYTNMLFFFIAGAFLFGYRDKIKEHMAKHHCCLWLPVVMIVVGIGGLVFVKYCATGSVAWGGVYITDGYSRLMTVILSVGIYLFFQNRPARKVGTFIARQIGTRTMGIYYLHMPLLVFCQVKLSPYYVEYYSFGLNILKTIIAVVICVLITAVLKKIPLVRELVK